MKTNPKAQKELKIETQKEDEIHSKSFYKVLGGAVLTAIVIGGAYVAFSLQEAKSKYHIVDLAGITRTYQEVAKQQALQDGISNEQRGQILDNLQKKMTLLEQTINEAAKDCKCNIFVKSAIVGQFDIQDVTAEIMAKVDEKAKQNPVVAPRVPLDTTSVTPLE